MSICCSCASVPSAKLPRLGVLFVLLLLCAVQGAVNPLTKPRNRQSGGFLTVGAQGAWLYYSEIIDRGEIVDDYRRNLELEEQKYGIDSFRVDTVLVRGWPKSDEYGGVWGPHIGYHQFVGTTSMYLHPRGSIGLGLRNIYDGSSQADYNLDENDRPIPDTVDGRVAYWVDFHPVKIIKSNYFFTLGGDVGALFGAGALEIDIRAGVTANLWIRYIGGILYKEHYRHVTVPLALECSFPIDNDRRIGLGAELTVMTRGTMEAYFDRQIYNTVHGTNFDILRADPMVLGNRTGVGGHFTLMRTLNDKTLIKMRPWITWHRFGESNIVSLEALDNGGWVVPEKFSHFLEPASTTWRWGLDLSVTTAIPYRR